MYQITQREIDGLDCPGRDEAGEDNGVYNTHTERTGHGDGAKWLGHCQCRRMFGIWLGILVAFLQAACRHDAHHARDGGHDEANLFVRRVVTN